MSNQLVHDLKLIVSTDKRIWAAAGFIVVTLVMWSLTDSWRPPIVIPEEKTVKLIQEVKEYGDSGSAGMAQDLSGLNKTNEVLKGDINRISEELNSKQEEITWQMDGLISRLSAINSTIDDITHKVGENKVQDVMREQRMKPRKIRGKKLE